MSGTVVDAVAARRGGSASLTVLGADGLEHTLAWSEVHQRARRIANLLALRGIGPGARVGLLADTSVELVAVLQAVWLSGAAVTVLPLPVRQSAEAYLSQLRRMIADARPGLVLVGDPLTALGAPLAGSAPVADLAALAARASTVEPMTPALPAPSDLAILQYTSGSTRQPRGVAVTHGQLAANVAAIRVATQHDRVHGCLLTWLPLYHDLGLIGGLALPMSCGCRLVLQSPAGFATRPMSWFEAITAHGATATAAPNFAWDLMARLLAAGPHAERDRGIRLDSLRLALTCAEPIEPRTMWRLAGVGRRHGLNPAAIACAYGLAEATLAVTVSTPGTGLRVDLVDPAALESRGEAVPVSGAGRPLARLGGPVPGIRLRIVDRVTGRELGARRVGHIEVAGDSVVRGYWGEPAADASEWLRTGDLGYLADGDLVVCGRESDLLFAAGRNVFPQDVEAAASTVPAVRAGNVAAFGVPGRGAGDRLVVAVESRAWADLEASGALRSAVSAAVVAEVGLTPCSVAVLPPGGLPKTSSGKVRRADARHRYLTGTLEVTR